MHPAIYNDLGWWRMDVAYMCACPSLDALCEWFSPVWRRLLAIEGFMLYVLTIHDSDVRVGKSGTQCAYMNEFVLGIEVCDIPY